MRWRRRTTEVTLPLSIGFSDESADYWQSTLHRLMFPLMGREGLNGRVTMSDGESFDFRPSGHTYDDGTGEVDGRWWTLKGHRIPDNDDAMWTAPVGELPSCFYVEIPVGWSNDEPHLVSWSMF